MSILFIIYKHFIILTSKEHGFDCWHGLCNLPMSYIIAMPLYHSYANVIIFATVIFIGPRREQ